MVIELTIPWHIERMMYQLMNNKILYLYDLQEVIHSRYTSYVMIWESSTNTAGLVDVDTGIVRKGVELISLHKKIFSGWYNCKGGVI